MAETLVARMEQQQCYHQQQEPLEAPALDEVEESQSQMRTDAQNTISTTACTRS